MYALRDYIGEDRMNRAIRGVLDADQVPWAAVSDVAPARGFTARRDA